MILGHSSNCVAVNVPTSRTHITFMCHVEQAQSYDSLTMRQSSGIGFRLMRVKFSTCKEDNHDLIQVGYGYVILRNLRSNYDVATYA